MRTRIVVLGIAVCWAASALAETDSSQKIHWERDLKKGYASMVKLERPMLLFVTAPGCVYCERMKNETFANKSVAKTLSSKFVTVQINGRKYGNLVKRLRLRAYPTTAFVHQNGTIVELLQGYRSAADLTEYITRVGSKLRDQSKLASATVKVNRN